MDHDKRGSNWLLENRLVARMLRAAAIPETGEYPETRGGFLAQETRGGPGRRWWRGSGEPAQTRPARGRALAILSGFDGERPASRQRERSAAPLIAK